MALVIVLIVKILKTDQNFIDTSQVLGGMFRNRFFTKHDNSHGKSFISLIDFCL